MNQCLFVKSPVRACPCDVQDFRGAIQSFRGISSSPILTLRCRWDWWVSGVNKVTNDLWGAMESSFLPAHSTSDVISQMAFTTASSTLGEEAMMMK